MASAPSFFVQNPTQTPSQASKRTRVNALEPDNTIPIIDFSILTSGHPHQRYQIIRDLDRACREWGFFILVNHGVSENLMKAVLQGCNEFFNLPMDEKMEYEGEDISKPVRFGSGVDLEYEKTRYWREFLKAYVHPQFNFPNKPKGFSEVAKEYSKRTREVTKELLKGVSKCLGFEESYIEKAMNLDRGWQRFVANLYPVCPKPENAEGFPEHEDHGLLTLLIENEIGGLQIKRNGEWFNVNSLPSSFLVNTGDQLERLSNGRYKSIKHRVVVNNKTARISIALPFGPPLNTLVKPAPELIEGGSGQPVAYKPKMFNPYMKRLRMGKHSTPWLMHDLCED